MSEFLRAHLDDLQRDQAAWSLKNFGEQEEQHPFFGVVEETGELFHALLKLAQGIRVNEDHSENAYDAIGDILIYMTSLCTTQGLKLSEMWPGFHDEPVFIGRRPLIRTIYYLGQIAGYFTSGGRDTAQTHDKAMLIHAIRAFLASLNAFCEVNEFGQAIPEAVGTTVMVEILFKTWATVSKRDWTKNKITGTV